MKYRILIVEDNIMLAGQQKKRLEKSGYEAEITIDEPGARKLLKKESFDLCAVRRTPAGRGRYIFARMDAEGTDGYPFHYHDRICLSTGCCTSHKTGSQRLSGKTGTDGRIAKTTERYFPSQICDMRQEQGFAPQKQPSDAGGRTSGQYSRPI